MSRIIGLAVAALIAVAAARADEKAEARAIVEKAVKAMGGKEKLAVDRAVAFKARGKFFGTGQETDYTMEFSHQPPEKMHIKMEFEANAMKFTFQLVFDGKKGWRKLNNDTVEMDKDAITEAKEDLYAGRVEALVPLLEDRAFELSAVGEVKVDDKPAVGIRVVHKGHRDINLYFDKKSGLLVKSERTIKDQEQGGKEKRQEKLFSDYKELGGAIRARKVVINRDDGKFIESEVTELELKDRIDPAEFAKP